MKFKQKLKKYRDLNNYSQKDIAKYLNITIQQYSLYETSKRQMPIEQYAKLAIKYQVSIDDMVQLYPEYKATRILGMKTLFKKRNANKVYNKIMFLKK